MKKIHELKNSGVIVAKLTDLVDGSFTFNEVAISAIKKYAQDELNIELSQIMIKTSIDCDLLTGESKPTGSHYSNSDHCLEVFETDEGHYMAHLYLSEVIRIKSF